MEVKCRTILPSGMLQLLWNSGTRASARSSALGTSPVIQNEEAGEGWWFVRVFEEFRDKDALENLDGSMGLNT